MRVESVGLNNFLQVTLPNTMTMAITAQPEEHSKTAVNFSVSWVDHGISHVCLNITPQWVCKVDDPPQCGWTTIWSSKDSKRTKKGGGKPNLHLLTWAEAWVFCPQSPISQASDSLELRPSALSAQVFHSTVSCPGSPSCRHQSRNSWELCRQLLIIKTVSLTHYFLENL